MNAGKVLAMTKLVYDFGEGNRTMIDLLGGKGTNLAEMTRLGLAWRASSVRISRVACTGSIP
jgi:pyruvate,orthophosphate dikinase